MRGVSDERRIAVPELCCGCLTSTTHSGDRDVSERWRASATSNRARKYDGESVQTGIPRDRANVRAAMLARPLGPDQRDVSGGSCCGSASVGCELRAVARATRRPLSVEGGDGCSEGEPEVGSGPSGGRWRGPLAIAFATCSPIACISATIDRVLVRHRCSLSSSRTCATSAAVKPVRFIPFPSPMSAAPLGDPRFLSCGGIAPEIWAELGARDLAFGCQLDREASFGRHRSTSVEPLPNNRRSHADSVCESRLATADFASVSDERLLRHAGTIALLSSAINSTARRLVPAESLALLYE